MKHRSSGHTQWLIPVLFILGSPALAYAHPAAGSVNGLIDGMAHPLGGLDHLCAMIGVGLWAAQRGGRAIWLAPLAFIVVMAIGGALGMLAVSIPFVEQGIVASVLILGILIAASIRLPLVLSVFIVGTFALFHGHAHGAEMPHTASGLMYAAGFIRGHRAAALNRRGHGIARPPNRGDLVHPLCRRRSGFVRYHSIIAGVTRCGRQSLKSELHRACSRLN